MNEPDKPDPFDLAADHLPITDHDLLIRLSERQIDLFRRINDLEGRIIGTVQELSHMIRDTDRHLLEWSERLGQLSYRVADNDEDIKQIKRSAVFLFRVVAIWILTIVGSLLAFLGKPIFDHIFR